MVYVASKPIEELHQHEALALVNRYAKLKGKHYEDIDYLYSIKHRKILEWLNEGTLKATKVIKRESNLWSWLQTAIDNKGTNLELLPESEGDYIDTESWMSDDILPIYRAIYDLIEGEIELHLSEAELQEILIEYETKLQNYHKALKIWQEEQTEYQKQYSQWENELNKALYEWASLKKLTVPKKKQKLQNFVNNARQQGFIFPDAPKQPHARKPESPTKPDKNYYISGTEYEIGMRPQVDAAIAWVKSQDWLKTTENYKDWDYKVFSDIEQKYWDEYCQEFKENEIADALISFQKILTASMSAEGIYEELTQHSINYEEIGIGTHFKYQRWGNSYYEHKYFHKGNEIAFSRTGLWLVEFESLIDSSITFHIPYSSAPKNLIKHLTSEFSEVESYGREITEEEMEIYPLKGLLDILDEDIDSLPFDFKDYSPRRFIGSYGLVEPDDWEDDDWEDDDWY